MATHSTCQTGEPLLSNGGHGDTSAKTAQLLAAGRGGERHPNGHRTHAGLPSPGEISAIPV